MKALPLAKAVAGYLPRQKGAEGLLTPSQRANLGRHSWRHPEISNVFRECHQRTDKCRRHGHRKLIRFSAHAPSAENSDVLAESSFGRRERVNTLGNRRQNSNVFSGGESSFPIEPTESCGASRLVLTQSKAKRLRPWRTSGGLRTPGGSGR